MLSPLVLSLKSMNPLFTMGYLLKVAIPILLGELQDDRVGAEASALHRPPHPFGAPGLPH